MEQEKLINLKNNFLNSRRLLESLNAARIFNLTENYAVLDSYMSRNNLQSGAHYSFMRFTRTFSFEIQLDFIDYWITYNKLNIFF
jgi:hypothetical protein